MKTPHAIIALVLLFGLSCASHGLGCGFYGPISYLGDGGAKLASTPQFYWEMEVKRLAKDFHPTEKLSKIQLRGYNGYYEGQPTDITPLKKATSDADVADFTDALKTRAITPSDPVSATQEHQAARDFISQTTDKTTNALPGEFDSEFSDYHKGAAAYALGKNHWEEARKAWEGLLQRPSTERHYRSIWASFMLGKLALKNNDPSAVKWFQMTRDLAKQGFADSLGMAADSYGWEGRSEWKQGHPEKAAPLYMTQLALGDPTAIDSLRVILPDMFPMENQYIQPDNVRKNLTNIQQASRDPLLRKLTTLSLLASQTPSWSFYGNGDYVKGMVSRWLDAVSQTNLTSTEDAEYLGWLAYSTGDYKTAARWLKLANPNFPAACWLRSKLQLRDGKLTDALISMSQAFQTLKSSYPDDSSYGDFSLPLSGTASGDLGQLHLTRGDFIQSLDTFLKGGHWVDTAFVAERVLTTDELKGYVDKQCPPAANTKDSYWEPRDLRSLLGRRLVRDGRYTEAKNYLPTPYDKILEKYVQKLHEGRDENLSNKERALAYFSAAWIARHDGMELMGTEGAPDLIYLGAIAGEDLSQERLSGKYVQSSYENGHDTKRTISMFPKPSKREQLRLEENQIEPNVRFHNRMIAADLALRAAKLLDNNTVELADVLNTAGNWVSYHAGKKGDRIENLLENRCPNTEIGKFITAKHWFVGTLGPWSQAQKDALNALHKELDTQPRYY